MTIKRRDSGWLVDIQPGERGAKRYRKTFDSKPEAARWEAYIRAQAGGDPDWRPKRKDSRRLSDLVSVWRGAHGSSLRDGVRRKAVLMRAAGEMGNPLADGITASTFIQWWTMKEHEGWAKTRMNNVLRYFEGFPGSGESGHLHGNQESKEPDPSYLFPGAARECGLEPPPRSRAPAWECIQ